MVVVVPDRLKYKFSDYRGMLLRPLGGEVGGRRGKFFSLSIPFNAS